MGHWLSGAVVGVAMLAVGCGAYEPEPEYPQQQGMYVAPRPLTSEELAAQQAARAENREIVIGGDDDEDEYSDADPSALTEFRPALETHGQWVDDATYGTVWVPAAAEVGEDFEPYVTAGHWTYSDTTDYVWVSDYSWGWAPFHYGRWANVPGHRWVWIPGRRYSGAWVTWRVGSGGYGYVGWAPAAPRWYWNHGVAAGWTFGTYQPYDHYVYCPHSYVYDRGVATHVVRGPAAREYLGRTHDYVPAQPRVNERVAARPNVGGRVPARPNVGPSPDELGMRRESASAPPIGNAGLDRARALARPSTAVAAGASAPTHLGPASRAPASAAFVPSEPRVGPRGPDAWSSGPSQRSSGVAPPLDRGPRMAGPSVSPGVHSAEPRVAAPSVTPRTSFRSDDHGSSSYASPRVSASPHFSSPSPRISASPSYALPSRPSASPRVSASPSPRMSAPSSLPQRSSPSVRSAPASAPHSLRAAPSVRSTPSVRASGGRRVGR